MRVPLLWTSEARKDLKHIYKHIAENSDIAAQKVCESIERQVQGLRTFPRMGPARSTLGEGRRVLVCGKYIAVYEVCPDPDGEADAERVEVLRIFHGARDLSRGAQRSR